MNQLEMKARTKRFALRLINLVSSLPQNTVAKSTADFIAKLSIVEEEADESAYWLELLVESEIVRVDRLASLIDEANQLVAIIVSAIKTTKQRRNPKSEFRNPKSE